jgi:hypothetical protein
LIWHTGEWCCRNSPAGRPAARPLGGAPGENGAPAPQYGDFGAQSGCRLSRASRGPGFSCCRTRPVRVTATGCLCYFHRGRGRGRLHISPVDVARPLSAVGARAGAAAHLRKHAVVERLKDKIPSSTSIYADNIRPGRILFSPC